MKFFPPPHICFVTPALLPTSPLVPAFRERSLAAGWGGGEGRSSTGGRACVAAVARGERGGGNETRMRSCLENQGEARRCGEGEDAVFLRCVGLGLGGRPQGARVLACVTADCSVCLMDGVRLPRRSHQRRPRAGGERGWAGPSEPARSLPAQSPRAPARVPLPGLMAFPCGLRRPRAVLGVKQSSRR